ncbi:MAG: esterase-like activity of phytase family protein [Sphingomonas adhaesiva]|uniref:esterase-like activity of phytase family protein n=1 Tax=Sphingomonas adhaesiva TaxID=28212 RepID=UPI002FF6EB67
MRWFVVLLLVLVLVPDWTGEARLPVVRRDLSVEARGFVPAGGARRAGVLVPVGALSLRSSDPAFGGFSSLAIHRGAAVLLSDGGNVVRLTIRRGRIAAAGADLADGPGTGWDKRSRDTESLAIDPASGRLWIGYERANAIWRYTPDLARGDGHVAPPLMRDWGRNSGPETLVRMDDGRFLTLREGVMDARRPRPAVLFDGDPVATGTRAARLFYRPPPGYVPTDGAMLPDGDLLVVNRRWRFPFRFDCAIVRVPATLIRAGAVMEGPVVARPTRQMGGENVEGIAITRERGATMVWLVTDNDLAFYRRTILAKFRLID